MGEANWFLSRNGQQFGPYTWEQLVQLARTGHIDGHDVVWRQGDAGSRPARDVEGLMPAAPGGSRGVVIGLAAGVIALVVALVVVLVSRNGGDDAASDSDSADTTEEVTTEPRTTTTVKATTTESPTTVEQTTTAAPTTRPTAPPTFSMPPTTQASVATESDLIEALPTADELPMSWAPTEGDVDTDVYVGSGPGTGLCGLDNFGTRAEQTGMVAFAENPEAFLPDDGEFYLGLLSFPSQEGAASFLALTASQADSCGYGFEYDIVEGEGPDTVDWINSSSQDGVIWHAVETARSMVLDPGTADERLLYAYETRYTTMTYDGVDLAVTSGEVNVLERYGTVILYGSLFGNWDVSGFGGWDSAFYMPTDQVTLDALDEVRDQVLADLRARGLPV